MCPDLLALPGSKADSVTRMWRLGRRAQHNIGLGFDLGLVNSSQGERNLQLALKLYY